MKMRSCYVIMFTLAITSGKSNLFAQSSHIMTNDLAGIYLTYEDYDIGKVASGFKLYQKNYSLWPQGFFRYKDIVLNTPEMSVVYKRSDIWGYTDHKGRLFRIFNNFHYKVLCIKGLVIYNIYSPTKTSYHFSKTLNEPIYRLTKKNIMTVYADNPDLLQRINFIKKKYWLIWDDKKESFLLNELYSKI